MRVVSEIDGLGSKNDEQNRETSLFKRLKEQNREVLLHQGVRFAFRVHQVQKNCLFVPLPDRQRLEVVHVHGEMQLSKHFLSILVCRRVHY